MIFGEWRWQVCVVQEDVVLAQSDAWHFWLNPFPREPLPTPRPCNERTGNEHIAGDTRCYGTARTEHPTLTYQVLQQM
jgi:hypothetical protein